MFLVLLFIVSLIGIGYAFTSKLLEGEKKQELIADVLDLDLYEGEEVIMENLYPLADPVGLIQEKSFRFRLTNKTANDTNYIVKLKKIDTSNELALTDVVYGLTKEIETSTGVLSELNNGVIDTGTIKGNQTINYELRFWLREDVEDDTTTYNKTLKYKINVEVSQKLTFNDLLKPKADTTTTIDFSKISSATNGRGIYKYTEDGEDVYYWRGAVTDNHVIFAGFCWEGVRTTSTGGLKMIYDGVVGSDGSCKNTGNNSVLANTSSFNENNNSPAYAGYMYGDVYEIKYTSDENESAIHTYAKNVEWNGSKYVLKDTINSTGVWSDDYQKIKDSYRYSCFNTTGICSRVHYIFDASSTSSQLIYLNNGEKIEDVWKKMNKNSKSSSIKTVIDDWYRLNLEDKNYSKYIEDTVYCNDRSVQNYGTWSSTSIGELVFSTYFRRNEGKPSLKCSKNDAFTIKETSTTNGMLDYPVGMLNVDEAIIAGGSRTRNSDYYLAINHDYWILSPAKINIGVPYGLRIQGGDYNGYINSGAPVSELNGVRPVISLSPSVLPNLTGTGTETDPYKVS